jgi:hypothetical protein
MQAPRSGLVWPVVPGRNHSQISSHNDDGDLKGPAIGAPATATIMAARWPGRMVSRVTMTVTSQHHTTCRQGHWPWGWRSTRCRGGGAARQPDRRGHRGGFEPLPIFICQHCTIRTRGRETSMIAATLWSIVAPVQWLTKRLCLFYCALVRAA